MTGPGRGSGTGRPLVLGLLLVSSVSFPGLSRAQGLEAAAQRAQRAWVAHAVGDLVSGSEAIDLRLPGASPVRAVHPAQARRILRDFLNSTVELEFRLRSVRQVGPGRGFAEGRRTFRVKGTSDELAQQVFLGFARGESGWQLREIRVSE